MGQQSFSVFLCHAPEIQRLVLQDARSVLGGASPEAQRHCIESMQRLVEDLIEQGVVAEADAEALASLIYGSLSETAFWIAERESSKRLERGSIVLDMLLHGLLIQR
ncbi:hypothetical protein [Pseudomonas sp. URMO17WK12:I4]|uniref:hypothetical protein n=1 Tax=Pseudomonas sp. URMO17WK12:I4 TaxID=1283292 RepID=UPI0035272B74